MIYRAFLRATLAFPISFCLITNAASAQDAPAPAVVSSTAELRQLDRETVLNGRLDADSRVSLVAQVSGVLTDVGFEPGDEVEEGDVLFRIDSSLYEAAVAEAEGALGAAIAARDLALLERDRQAELVERQTTSQAVLDNAEAQLAAREADVLRLTATLDRAEINLSYTEITAPFSGVVGPSTFDAGTLIGPQSGSLALVTQLDPIHVEFQISTAELRDFMESVEAGEASQTAAVTLELANGSIYERQGDIDFIDTTVSQGTDSVRMRARFDNPEGQLLDQELVRVNLSVESMGGELTVPQQAVQRDIQGAYVIVVADGSVAEQRRVEAGRTSQGFTVIEAGLSEGDTVITEGINKVRLGAPVDAAPAEGN